MTIVKPRPDWLEEGKYLKIVLSIYMKKLTLQIVNFKQTQIYIKIAKDSF